MIPNDWTNQLRKRMDGYEAAVPEQLWDDIQQSLSHSKVRPIALWRRWVGVAAVAVVTLGIGWWLWPETATEVVSPVANTALTADNHASVPRTEPKLTVQAAPEPVAKPQPAIVVAAERVGPTAQEVTTNEEEVIQNEVAVIQQNDTVERMNEVAAIQQNNTMEKMIPHNTRTDASTLRIGIMANDGLLAYQQTNHGAVGKQLYHDASGSNPSPSQTTNSGSPTMPTEQQEQQHHDHPLSFGLTADYRLSRHWSLQSGIVYTRLHSEFVRATNQIQTVREQTLHYIGLPLHLQYSVVDYRRWTLYLSAGTQVDWNVKNKTTNQRTDTKAGRDRMQWSVGAAAGVEYHLVPQLSIYAQPGYRYYFDNGSTVQNFFKSHPSSWSLQFGLRLQFPH